MRPSRPIAGSRPPTTRGPPCRWHDGRRPLERPAISDTSGSLKDKAAEKVAHEKEAVTDAAAKAKDKATDLAAKGQTAMAERKATA